MTVCSVSDVTDHTIGVSAWEHASTIDNFFWVLKSGLALKEGKHMMKRLVKILFLVLILCLYFISIDREPVLADTSRPLADQGPTRVDVFLYMIDLDEIYNESQSFDANIYIEFRWTDPRLAHNDSDKVSRHMTEVWNPRIQILNQQKIWSTFPNMVEISPKGEVVHRQRLWGSFSQPLDLKNFPFDHQTFVIQLAAVGFSLDEVELVPDHTRGSIAEKLSVPDWEITSWDIKGGSFVPVPGSKIPGFTFTFQGKRHIGYFVVKVLIPMFLIVAMSWVVFWIDPKEGGTQISVAITTMLTLIAYRFAVGTDVPKISELTKLDAFIIGASFLVFATLIEVIVTSSYAKSGKVERAMKIDRWARWLFPISFILISLEALVFRFTI